MTRLSCHRSRADEGRPWLTLIACNLRNLWRQLMLPMRIDTTASSMAYPRSACVCAVAARPGVPSTPFGFEFKKAEMGNTVRFEVKTPREVATRHENSYAQLNAFDWSN